MSDSVQQSFIQHYRDMHDKTGQGCNPFFFNEAVRHMVRDRYVSVVVAAGGDVVVAVVAIPVDPAACPLCAADTYPEHSRAALTMLVRCIAPLTLSSC